MNDYQELSYKEKLILAKRLLMDIASEEADVDFQDIEVLDLLLEKVEIVEEMQ